MRTRLAACKSAWILTGLLLAVTLSYASGARAAEPTSDDSEQSADLDIQKTMNFLRLTRAVQPTAVTQDLSVIKLSDHLYMHRSYFSVGDQRLHANGLVFISDHDITVIDSPWSVSASYDLLDWLEQNFDLPVRRLVITHAHEDRMAGIDAFIDRHITVYSQRNTALLARQQGWTAPHLVFDGQMLLRAGNQAIELYYPGPGHSPDNIVVWIPSEKALFAGSLVRSLHNDTLGFTGDADKAAWPGALERVAARYPDAQLVIPSHGLPGTAELIDHTLSLLRK